MNINIERFLALTAMLAAPLVSASGCVINSSDDDDTNGSNSNSNSNTNPSTDDTGAETSNTSPSTTTPSDSSGTGDSTAGDTTGADSSAGESTAADSGSSDGTTGADLGNCCSADHGAGCDVADVNDCVCDQDPICCEEDWDMICVGEVNTFECGVCELPPTQWDCSCTADCDGEAVGTIWQVCGSDDADAAANAQTQCDADLGGTCEQHTCADCVCATAEAPEVDCG